MLTFTHDGVGTDESAWRRWLADGALPTLDAERLTAGRPVVVLAAHPDDETLGAGGLVAVAARHASRLVTVVATRGERSHPRSPTTSADALAVRRERELRMALDLLQGNGSRRAPGPELELLGLPDGGLSGQCEHLVDRLAELVVGLTTDSDKPPLLVAPWRRDGHPDHEAVGRAAADLATRHGCELLEYPVWAWHWATPPDGDADLLGWDTAVRVPLPDEVRRRKRSAVAAHTSQVSALSDQPGDEVLLGPALLAHFDRPDEVYLHTAAPESLAPQYFQDFYAVHGADPWGFEDRWYERRKRDLTLAALPRPRFRRAVEPGCSIGVLTEQLAARCDEVVALDPVPEAVARASARTAAWPGVVVVEGAVPADWPDGRFDLVVLSEVGYYVAGADLRELVRRAEQALEPDGVLVACHWRHRVPDYPLTGDQVHAALRSSPDLVPLATHVEADFVLDVLVRPGAPSVAQQQGLAP